MIDLIKKLFEKLFKNICLGATEPVITRAQFDELTEWVRQTPEQWAAMAGADDGAYEGAYTNDQIDAYIKGNGATVSLN